MRAIDADALKEMFERYLAAPHVNDRRSPLSYGIKMGIEGCISYLNNAPTLDVAPVVHGKWVFADDGYLRCSECTQKAPVVQPYDDEPTTTATNYCPYCGARMDNERKDN